jgi:hypothetical protein
MYRVTPVKSEQAEDVEFGMAVDCARDSIESVLHEEGMTAQVIGGKTVLITPIDQTSAGIGYQECKDKVAGCFCDDSGRLYPEFSNLEFSATAT